MTSSKLKRYKKWALSYILISLLIMVGAIIEYFMIPRARFFQLSTGDIIIDGCIIFFLLSLLSTIAAILFGYVTGPLFLFLHKKTIGRKMIYGVRSKPRSQKFNKIFGKLLFPALMSMNFIFNLYNDPNLSDLIVYGNISNTISPIFVLLWLLPWFSIIGMGLFSGAYFLNDAGIIYTNKNLVRSKSNPVELRSVGNWYMQILKGYAGIAVLFNYYQFIFNFASSLSTSSDFIGIYVMYVIFWPLIPFILTFLMIPAAIALDVTHQKRTKYIIKYANKLGIDSMIENPLDLE